MSKLPDEAQVELRKLREELFKTMQEAAGHQFLLPRSSGYESDRLPESHRGRIYSAILKKYIDPNTGEIIKE